MYFRYLGDYVRKNTGEVLFNYMVMVGPSFWLALIALLFFKWSLLPYFEAGALMVAAGGTLMSLVRGSLGFGDYRRQRLSEFKARYEGLAAPQRKDADALREALQGALDSARRIDDREIRQRVERIVATIDKSAPLMLRLKSQFPDHCYTLREAAVDYLPTTLEGYHAMVALKTQDSQSPEGKTMRQHVLEQLGTIENSISELIHDMEESGKNAVLANGLFLQQRLENKKPSQEAAPADDATPAAPAAPGGEPAPRRTLRSGIRLPRI